MGNIPQATPAKHRRKSLGGSHRRLRALKIAGGFPHAEAMIRFSPECNRSDDSGGMVGPARQLCSNAGGGNRIACGSQCPQTGLLGTWPTCNAESWSETSLRVATYARNILAADGTSSCGTFPRSYPVAIRHCERFTLNLVPWAVHWNLCSLTWLAAKT